MKLNILAFGVAKEIFQSDNIILEIQEASTVADLKSSLEKKYSALENIGSYMIAINKEYVHDLQTSINSGDEIAIIPPVSGG